MSSNGRLLRKLRKIMGAAVASLSLVACSSQISCGIISFSWSSNDKVTITYSHSDISPDTSIQFDRSCEPATCSLEAIPTIRVVLLGFSGIAWGTFEGRSYLGSITVSGPRCPVSAIWDRAFCDCKNLQEVEITLKVTKICNGAFSGCERLKKISIPSSVKTIGDRAFNGCINLEKFEIPKNVNRIGKSAFCYCSKLCKITIPDSVDKIEPSTFEGCKSLTTIDFPTNVQEIGNCAFRNCKTLEKITFQGVNVIEICSCAFEGCECLEKVEFPYSLVWIGSSVFEGCTNLAEVVSFNDLKLDSKDDIFDGCSKELKISNMCRKIKCTDVSPKMVTIGIPMLPKKVTLQRFGNYDVVELLPLSLFKES